MIGQSTGEIEMRSKTKEFDIKYYVNLAHAIYDADSDFTKTSTRVSNRLMGKLIEYVKKYDPLPSNVVEQLKNTLDHENKGVRIAAAADLLLRGYAVGWPVIATAAFPAYFPDDDAPIDEWRSFCAGQSARRFISGLYRSIEHLPLSPRLEELEESWARAGFPAPLPMINDILVPNIPIR